jgi:hypothetical protein
MNITLSIDETIIREAREAAAAMGKSLNEVIREDLERLTRRQRRAQDLAELLSLSGQGDSKGLRFDREALHERDGNHA